MLFAHVKFLNKGKIVMQTFEVDDETPFKLFVMEMNETREILGYESWHLLSITEAREENGKFSVHP